MTAPRLSLHELVRHRAYARAQLVPDALQLVHVDGRAPVSRLPRSGYGETGTRYRVTLADGRTRRVYARTYGNGAALGVYVDAAWVALDADAEAALERADASARRERGTVTNRHRPGYPFTYSRADLAP